MILESEEHQNCTSDSWSNGNDKEEPHKDPTNHHLEHYHKRTTFGGCLGLIDDPEKSPLVGDPDCHSMQNKGWRSHFLLYFVSMCF